MKFIRVTNASDGEKVYLNVEKITTLNKGKDGTSYINTVSDFAVGFDFHVSESTEKILKMIESKDTVFSYL